MRNEKGQFLKGTLPAKPFKKGDKGFWLGKKRPPFSKEWKKNMAKPLVGNKNAFGHKMSEEGKKLHIARMKGNQYNYQGGKTTLSLRIRTSKEYELWRKSCFERDGFICQKTKVSGGGIVVHHINNFADYPELRLAIDNGITLSKKSHDEFHKMYGKKNNTREQLIEFLTSK